MWDSDLSSRYRLIAFSVASGVSSQKELANIADESSQEAFHIQARKEDKTPQVFELRILGPLLDK